MNGFNAIITYIIFQMLFHVLQRRGGSNGLVVLGAAGSFFSALAIYAWWGFSTGGMWKGILGIISGAVLGAVGMFISISIVGACEKHPKGPKVCNPQYDPD